MICKSKTTITKPRRSRTLDKHFKQTFCELIYNWKFPEPTQIRQNVVKSDVKKSQICPILHWSLDTKLGFSMTNDLKEAKPVLNPEHPQTKWDKTASYHF